MVRRISPDKLALAAEKHEKEEKFWLKELGGEFIKSNFPFDFKKSSAGERRPAAVTFRFPDEVFERLTALSKGSDYNLNVILAAGLTILLYKYTGSGDILFGSPIYKQGVDTEFINTLLVLRHRFDGSITFKEMLLSVSRKIVEATDNYCYPLERLTGKLSLPVSEGEFPFFDTAVVLDNIHDKSYLGDISLNALFSFTRTGHIEGTVEFDSLLYRTETMERVTRHFINLFRAALFNPDIPVDGIDILSEEEKKQLAETFNDTASVYPRDKTVHELFEEQARQKPDAAAVKVLNRTDRTYGTYMTYKELNLEAGELAGLLIKKGVTTDTVVGIMTGASKHMAVGLLAILKAGGAYLPVNAAYPPKRKKYLLEDSGISILLTDGEYEEIGREIEIMNLDDIRGPFEKFPLTGTGGTGPEQLAYVIYTSGTTGGPKGVMVEHRNVVRLVKNTNFITFGDNERILQTGALEFDASTFEIWGALLNGFELYLADREQVLVPEQLKETIGKHQITTIWMTSPLFNRMANADIEIFRGLRNLLVGGDVLSPPHIERVRTRFPGLNIINGYGPTENTTFSTTFLIDREYVGSIPIGRPVANSTVYIIDGQGELVPVGVPGELTVGGDGIARGYLNQPGLTAEKFNRTYGTSRTYRGDRTYRTGDMARWVFGGEGGHYIEFLGRRDQQVKIRGFRIETGEIEKQLAGHPGIKEAVVICQTDGSGEKYLCAYVVTTGGAGGDGQEFKQYLSRLLPDYMIPSYFVTLDEIPLTPNGKIDRRSLPEPQIKTGAGTAAAPRTPLEEKLVEMWKEVLGIPHSASMGIDDNFFEMGGHSLRATILVSRIHKELNVKVPLEEVFGRQTVRELAQFIDEAGKTKYAEIEAVEKREYYPLSSAQKRLYFLQEMDPESTGYNIPFVIPLGKDIDKNKLETVLKQLIARHESLRTCFRMVKGEPVQVVHGDVTFEIEYCDAAPGNFILPFDLSRAPLMRSLLVKLPGGFFAWVVDIHHIVSDGTSQMVLSEDFAALYGGAELEPLRIQYKDFSQWQNRLFESGEIKAQEDYWLELYSGEIPRLEFPVDYKRPEVFTFRGDGYAFTLDREDVRKFRVVGSRNGATLYMNILAALNALFYRYTGQGDIIVGSGIAGRPHSDLQRIVGMFVNTLAVRNYPEGEKSYENFLQEVVSNSVRAFDNQDVQFEELVDKLNLERDTSRNPLFDISMVVQNFGGPGRKETTPVSGFEAVELTEDALSSMDYSNPTSKFDMTFFIMEEGDEVRVGIEYYTSVYKAETIHRLSAHFKNLIRAAAVEPSVKLKALDFISREEREQLLFEFNRTAAEYPADKTLVRLFEEQVERRRDGAAVIGTKQEFVTYGELNGYADRLAGYLYTGKKIDPEERVGLLLDKAVDLYAAVLGILKAGGAYVPLDTSSPVARLKTIINDAGTGILLSQKRYIKVLNALQWECPTFHTFLCLDSEDILAEDEREENELMSRELWHYVGETAVDDITGGGWVSSYTGKPMSRIEMDEFGDNILEKLKPFLHPGLRVLEIGTASGLSMFRIAPLVGFYHGTDLSSVIIEKNGERVEREGFKNIALSCLAAHEIDRAGEKGTYDLIIMNSVIQSFHGHNYLLKVLGKVIDLLGDRGHLFIGDVMDLDRKGALVRDMMAFKYDEANRNKGYTTKTDFSSELFLSRGFWEQLGDERGEVVSVGFSDKIHTAANELTKFRYDVLIEIDKKGTGRKVETRHPRKYREDLRHLRGAGDMGDTPAAVWPWGLAYVIYTSGTTGRPKGVMVEHGSVVNLAVSQGRYFGVNARDRILQFSSICFDASVEQVFTAFFNGAALVLVDRETLLDVDRFYEYVVTRGVTHIHAVPSFYDNLRLSGEGGLKRIVAGGDVCSPVLAARLSGICDFYNEYGPTETTVTSIEMKFSKGEVFDSFPSLPIGRPVSNTIVYLVDRELRLVPPGAAGEMYIGGSGVTRGYMNHPELTSEKFYKSFPGVQGAVFQKRPLVAEGFFYKTGDLARWLPGGVIEFLGRVDSQVKIRGYRIELKEIESQLLGHEEIKAAAVVLKGEGEEDRYLCAYIVPRGEDTTVEEIKRYLSRRLPDYMVPAYYVTLETLPVTSGGKVDRKALLKYKESRTGVSSDFVPPRSAMEKEVAGAWRDVLRMEAIGIHDNFFEMGGNSINILKVQGRLKKSLERDIPVVKLFKYPTIHSLAGYLDEEGGGAAAELALSGEITRGKDMLKERTGAGERGTGLEVAVIGMAGVFPGARNVREFWENLKNGVESISFFTDEELAETGVSADISGNPAYVRAKGVIDEPEYFDYSFFNYTPKEASAMDPQMRIFHQCVWEALEDAGYDPYSYPRRIGLYAGSSPNLYWETLTVFSGTGSSLTGFQSLQLRDKDFMCTRVSYKLNLKGPSFSVQTACSTSLVAIHLAVQGLLNGECEIALGGGVTVVLPQRAGYFYQQGMVESPDGHCRAFDIGSNGVVAGNGGAVVVLKRLSDAAADRDHIYAVVKGSAINNDGTRKVGYTAPSVEGQAEVVRAAQYMAGAAPETITYLEAHGTGTDLGDPVEVEALKTVFGVPADRKPFCGIGTVKSNIGHLDTAAGAAGFIKTVLALKHGVIPPSLHFQAPNPRLGLEGSPFYVVSSLTGWKRLSPGVPRRAGVSSLGIGGTNAHVVLEEWPGDYSPNEGRKYGLVLLSARTPSALEKMTGNFAEYLKRGPNFDDAAYTLQVGRKAFEYRKMAVCRNAEEAVEKLTAPTGTKAPVFMCKGGSGRYVVFLFPGQGSQYVDMARELYETEAVFREHLDRCFALSEPHTAVKLRDILYPSADRGEGPGYDAEEINQTEIAQPLLFSIEYALAKLLMMWGIVPYGMMGHSIGEYTAACLSGVFSLEDALMVVAHRGRLMQGLPSGGMLSVALPEEKLAPLVKSEKELALAAVNSSSLCVVSGPNEVVDRFGEKMAKTGHKVRKLVTSHAFHSAMMDPVLSEFEAVVRSVRLHKPGIPFISNVSGIWIKPEEAVDPRYWANHLRHTVRFADGLETLFGEHDSVFVEVGPGRTLSAFVKQHRDKKAGHLAVNLMKHAQEHVSDGYFLADALGQLWLYGAAPDWEAYHSGENRSRVSLPTYPFEKEFCWVDETRIRQLMRLISGSPEPEETPVSSSRAVGAVTVPKEFGVEYEAPRDDLEEAIAGVWQEILGFDRVGIHSNFFDINGDSLTATQLVARLQQMYPVEITLKRFFEEPTIAHLAELIRELLIEKVKTLSDEELEKINSV